VCGHSIVQRLQARSRIGLCLGMDLHTPYRHVIDVRARHSGQQHVNAPE
jgi:hypothetical protein